MNAIPVTLLVLLDDYDAKNLAHDPVAESIRELVEDWKTKTRQLNKINVLIDNEEDLDDTEILDRIQDVLWQD